MESATVEKSEMVHVTREQVRTAQSAFDVLAKRAEALDSQKTEAERLVHALESSRAEIISTIGKGTASDADLAKVKKELSRARDTLADTGEILKATETALKEAQRDLQRAIEAWKVEEARAWRHVSTALAEQHREALQSIMDRMFVASNNHQPGVQYWSLINTLGLGMPTGEAQARIREELKSEFGI